MKKTALIFCFFSGLLLVNLIFAADYPYDTSDYTYQYYHIYGDSAEKLAQEMADKGPGSYHALAKWNVYWRYDFDRKGKTCRLKDVRTKNQVVITFPRWANKQDSNNQQLKLKWSNYTKALNVHELGHAKFSELAKQEVVTALESLPAHENGCKVLSEMANQKAREVIKKYADEEIAYDRDTGHGRTQGALFRLE